MPAWFVRLAEPVVKELAVYVYTLGGGQLGVTPVLTSGSCRTWHDQPHRVQVRRGFCRGLAKGGLFLWGVTIGDLRQLQGG